MDMNRFLIVFLLLAGFVFAVKPVPRSADESKNDKPAVTIQEQKDGDQNVEVDVKNVMTKNDNNDKDKDKDKDNDKTQIKNKPPVNKDDKIVDVDSNNVNDQRENDLLKIKQLKSKFQDLFKKKPADDNEKNDERKKPSKPVTPPKKKTR